MTENVDNVTELPIPETHNFDPKMIVVAGAIAIATVGAVILWDKFRVKKIEEAVHNITEIKTETPTV